MSNRRPTQNSGPPPSRSSRMARSASVASTPIGNYPSPASSRRTGDLSFGSSTARPPSSRRDEGSPLGFNVPSVAGSQRSQASSSRTATALAPSTHQSSRTRSSRSESSRRLTESRANDSDGSRTIRGSSRASTSRASSRVSVSPPESFIRSAATGHSSRSAATGPHDNSGRYRSDALERAGINSGLHNSGLQGSNAGTSYVETSVYNNPATTANREPAPRTRSRTESARYPVPNTNSGLHRSGSRASSTVTNWDTPTVVGRQPPPRVDQQDSSLLRDSSGRVVGINGRAGHSMIKGKGWVRTRDKK